MPHYWITANDGSVNFHTEDNSSDAAFERLAHSLEYADYSQMCRDLGYVASSFTVAAITEETAEYSKTDDRRNIDKQRTDAVRGVFKYLRRVGAG